MTVRALIPVLGDQLSAGLASLRAGSKESDVVLMVEVAEETTYVRHHKQKIVLVLAAMRHFAAELRAAGWRVDYVRLDEADNTGSFAGEVKRAARRHSPERILVTEPGEWRVLQSMEGWSEETGLPVEILPDDRFVCSREEFSAWAKDRNSLTMEFFYRDRRRKTGLLMDHDRPEGGRWNFDAENRKPAERDLFMPKPERFRPDDATKEVMALVAERFADHFGDLEPFGWAVTRSQALKALDAFVDKALPRFGDYQDAMLRDEDFLYHAVISPYINIGLLDPLEVCRRIEDAWRAGDVPINAAEGFIRQIIGWREYVRGVYWLKMPDYGRMNALEARRDLPWFYWSGETGMACMAAAIGTTRRNAYAHHIQRLMVTGTFALLAGIEPRQIHEWYLVVYADAFEWVELPNVIGMSQFADGGILGTKPYAASGAYIDRMSDYCATCRYDVKKRIGDDACPFNALYWDFLARNEDVLGGNRRLAMPYRTWQRMDDDTRRAIRRQAAGFLEGLSSQPD
jgi:deoxyribodipyrimidine photolyase-related protein